MVQLRVEARYIVTMDRRRRILREAAIAADAGRIVALDRLEAIKRAFPHVDQVIRGSRLLVIPGLVNCHTHLFQSLLRGTGDDLTLATWLQRAMFPALRRLKPRHVRAGAWLGCLENLRSGVTTVVDNHHVCTGREATEAVAEALLGSGLRGVVARGMALGTPWARHMHLPRFLVPYSLVEEVGLTEELIRQWRQKGRGRVTIGSGPVASIVASPALLEACTRLAQRYDAPVHMHVAESRDDVESSLRFWRKREVEYLAQHGFLTSRFQVVHGVWLTPHELRLLATHGAHLVHCPVSNMYLASGVAPLPSALAAGVNIALGTDGPGSNTAHDMFETIKMTALLQKVITLEPRAVTGAQALEMATLGGARALGWHREIGSLEVGKRADLVALDLDRGFGTPVHDMVSTVVFAMGPQNVVAVVVDGEVVWRGRAARFSEEHVLRDAEREAADLVPSR
jgi:5-methylthioadenosine/S-adenosylhomocysteine deaminase